jgi:DmsE family decaheme c-type cytochrome
MHTNWPETQSFKGVVPGKHPGLRVFLIILLGAGMLCATALAAAQQGAKAPDAPATPAGHAEFVGSDTCATCHAEVAKGFAANPHQKMALMHGNADGVTCENCHGAGSEHVAGGGDVTKIFDPAKASVKDVDTKCLSCHASAHPNFERSPHAKASVGCTSCHSIHGSKEETLLKAPQPTLCYQCHADQKAQFDMPIHHRVNEGLIKCTDCHDVHGTFLANNLRSTEDQNQICTKCHTDVRGPFTFEHAPVRAEGCVTCHTPHGSQNPRLLNMPSIATLCNQCHSPLSAGGVHGLDAGSTTVTPCITCHTMIHGSNVSQAFVR